MARGESPPAAFERMSKRMDQAKFEALLDSVARQLALEAKETLFPIRETLNNEPENCFRREAAAK